MRDIRHWAIASILLALTAAPCLAADDGITLIVDPGITPGDVSLDWSGGTSPYRVYRSETATGVATTVNLLGETSSTFWDDTPPPGDVFFYRVRSVPTVFRVTDIDLMDPHVFVSIIILCLDVTNSDFNPALQDLITMDADLDGLLDFNMLFLFRPLDQASADGNVDLGIGECLAPVETTSCDQDDANPPVAAAYSNVTIGSCLAPLPGTTSGYSPAVAPTNAPPTCFVSDDLTFGLDLGGATVPLQDTQVSANYVGDPADSLINGLMRGFIAEDVADTVMVDLGTGPVPLSSLLPGGSGNCASGDDRDLGLDHSTVGWWLYLNFTAEEVPYVGP